MSSNLDRATQIVSAFVSNHPLEAKEVTVLLESVFLKLEALSGNPKATPPTPLEDSIHDDHLVCLEDGAKVILLKRYLAKRFNLTPEQYIEKWHLPSDYPMVAKTYSERRSEIARSHGLGKSPG